MGIGFYPLLDGYGTYSKLLSFGDILYFMVFIKFNVIFEKNII